MEPLAEVRLACGPSDVFDESFIASLAIDVLATVTPLTTQIAIDQVIGRRRVDWLFLVSASAAAFVTFSALWSLLRGSLLVRVRARLDVAITQRFVGHSHKSA